MTRYTLVKHSTCTVYMFLIYNDRDDKSTTNDVPTFLRTYPFLLGTGTSHPTEQAYSASIQSNMVGNEDVNSQPLDPHDTYDKLPPQRVSNEDLDTQPLHPPNIYDKLCMQKVRS